MSKGGEKSGMERGREAKKIVGTGENGSQRVFTALACHLIHLDSGKFRCLTMYKNLVL